MRDLRNKMTLMEMTDQRSTLRDKEITPQRITSIENKRHRIQLGANGMISSVALLDGNTIPKKMFEVNFNQTYVIFDGVIDSLIEVEFNGTNSTKSTVNPSRSREISLDTDVQIFTDGIIETCLVQAMSIRYLSPMFVEQRICLGKGIEQTFKVEMLNRKQELYLGTFKHDARFEYYTDDSLDLTLREPDLNRTSGIDRKTFACTDGMVAVDKNTNTTIAMAGSVPLACSFFTEVQFGMMIARSIETKDSLYDMLDKGPVETKLMLTVEKLDRSVWDLDEEEFPSLVSNQVFHHSNNFLNKYYYSKLLLLQSSTQVFT